MSSELVSQCVSESVNQSINQSVTWREWDSKATETQYYFFSFLFVANKFNLSIYYDI